MDHTITKIEEFPAGLTEPWQDTRKTQPQYSLDSSLIALTRTVRMRNSRCAMDYKNTYNEALAKEIQKSRKVDDESYIPSVELHLASKAYAFQTMVEQDRA
jgi:hypothetical protein